MFKDSYKFVDINDITQTDLGVFIPNVQIPKVKNGELFEVRFINNKRED